MTINRSGLVGIAAALLVGVVACGNTVRIDDPEADAGPPQPHPDPTPYPNPNPYPNPTPYPNPNPNPNPTNEAGVEEAGIKDGGTEGGIKDAGPVSDAATPDTTPLCEEIVPFQGIGSSCPMAGAAVDTMVTPPDMSVPLGSTCMQTFPPTATLPCAVPEAGTVYYVNAKGGSDANDGLSPASAWATLFHAVAGAAPQSTVRVAEGEYLSASVHVNKALIVKGGWDATFADWNPDTHVTRMYGLLTLNHDHAIWGGFHLIRRTTGQKGAWFAEHGHIVVAGTLLRNYMETVYTPSEDQFHIYAVMPGACQGHTTHVVGNDIYVRGEGTGAFGAPLGVNAIEYGNSPVLSGKSELARNRICTDRSKQRLWYTEVVGGYGGCGSTRSRVDISNNILEGHGSSSVFGQSPVDAIHFYGCSQSDLDVVVTNNTIFSDLNGMGGYPGSNPAKKVYWRLTNNIVFAAGSPGAAVLVAGAKGAPTTGVEIVESSGNLTFGFADNGIFPAPLASSGDNTTGTATAAQVFGPDLTPAAGGPASGTGINVAGIDTYGNVKHDLFGQPRPAIGPWSRGARE